MSLRIRIHAPLPGALRRHRRWRRAALSPTKRPLDASRVPEAPAGERERLLSALSLSRAAVCVVRGPALVIESIHPSLAPDGPERWIGRPVHELFGNASPYVRILAQVLAEGIVVEGEELSVRRRRERGGVLESYCTYSCVPTRGAGGSIDGALLFVVDVTGAVHARRTAERARAALQGAEARLRLAVEAAAVGIWEFDFLLGRVSLDRRCATILGRPGLEEHSTTDALLPMVHPADRERVRQAVLSAFDPSGEGELSLECRLHASEPRWVALRGRTTFDITAYPVICTGTLVDVTRFKLSEIERDRLLESEQGLRAAAESASRAKDDFLAMLGHELRNPLSPITTATELMRMRAPSTFARERTVIERQVTHLKRLVDDLLDVSRVTRGRIELNKTKVKLASAIETAVDMVSPLLESKQHAFRADVAEDLFVDADEHRLGQIFANLLTNAAKYTDFRGHVDVTAARIGSFVEVRVRDTGAGMSAELLASVFELFVQGARTLDRAEGGLGIGLTVAKALVELHGGSIDASSDGPGRGSEFVVRLPAADGDAASAGADQPLAGEQAEATTRARVLVVDDNRDAADLLAEGLLEAGYEANVAYDGPSALAIAARARHDVALLDLGLPVMDGLELGRRLRALEARTSLVAVTGYGQSMDRARTRDAGFDEHVVKPVGLERILSVVKSVLERTRPEGACAP